MKTIGDKHKMRKGSHHTEKSKKKLSETRKRKITLGEIVVATGYIHTEKTRAKMRQRWKEKKMRGYEQWNKGYTKETHPSIAQAAKTQKKTKSKMNIVAWNKGLTKEINPYVAKQGKIQSKIKRRLFREGKLVMWNKGLTKETDERVAKFGRSQSKTKLELFEKGELVIWSKGKTKETHPSLMKTSDKMRVIAVNRKGVFPRTNTSIETLLQVFLRKKNIQFETDKPLLGITRVDVFIEPNTCIYADGDYWHTLPGKQEKDDKINKILVKRGYKVLRFWGTEIRTDPEKCVSKILDTIKN